jgi:uncharacterized protein (TIGR00645 family)
MQEQAVASKLEVALEWTLFSSRWLLAPLYLGMVLAVAAVLVSELSQIAVMDGERVILLSLSLIDLSLTANLLLIVIFAGYENFVSKLHIGEHEDRPSWMGAVDFSGLKLKLIASIVAISAIALLRAFLPLGDPHEALSEGRLRWMVVIHLTFVVSGVLLAAMDWINARVDKAH